MPSNSKIDANGRNSQLSTGPRSDAAKSVVTRNASKHNLTSLNIATASEDLEELQILLHGTAIDLAPRSTIENALVEQIAYAEWKLLRIARWETEIINAAMTRLEGYCQKLFGETPAEALTRLHRYEAQIRHSQYRFTATNRSLVEFSSPLTLAIVIIPKSRIKEHGSADTDRNHD